MPFWLLFGLSSFSNKRVINLLSLPFDFKAINTNLASYVAGRAKSKPEFFLTRSLLRYLEITLTIRAKALQIPAKF